MRPFVVIMGILMGSLVSIAFGLAVVVLVFWLLQEEYERFAAEMPALLRSAGIFTLLAALGTAAFFATLYNKTWRHVLLGLLWLGLGLTGLYYWPY